MSVISSSAIGAVQQGSPRPRTRTSSVALIDSRPRARKGRLRKVLRGFTRVAAELAATRRAPGSFAVIGSGDGAEAIGAAAVFPMLSRLTLVDRNATVLALAAANVAAAIDPEIKLMALSSLLMRPMTGGQCRSDMIYADLTAFPQASASGAGASDRANAADRLLASRGLDDAQRFLTSARTLIHPGGIALLLVSGRSGQGAIDLLAATSRFRIEIVVSGFERQADAKAVLTRCAAAESDEATFEFYDFFGARTQFRQTGASSAAETLMAPWRVSAREALHAVASGSIIGHRFHLLKAIPLEEEAAQ